MCFNGLHQCREGCWWSRSERRVWWRCRWWRRWCSTNGTSTAIATGTLFGLLPSMWAALKPLLEVHCFVNLIFQLWAIQTTTTTRVIHEPGGSFSLLENIHFFQYPNFLAKFISHNSIFVNLGTLITFFTFLGSHTFYSQWNPTFFFTKAFLFSKRIFLRISRIFLLLVLRTLWWINEWMEWIHVNKCK